MRNGKILIIHKDIIDVCQTRKKRVHGKPPRGCVEFSIKLKQWVVEYRACTSRHKPFRRMCVVDCSRMVTSLQVSEGCWNDREMYVTIDYINLVEYNFLITKKFAPKSRGLALAFQNPKPGQSRHEAVLTAWPGSRPQAGPSTAPPLPNKVVQL
jgi:hypothetical protein